MWVRLENLFFPFFIGLACVLGDRQKLNSVHIYFLPLAIVCLFCRKQGVCPRQELDIVIVHCNLCIVILKNSLFAFTECLNISSL